MASCDWQKIKTATEAKAILRHSAEDKRRTDKHSNKDIDPARSGMNISIGAMTSYREACEAYDERIADLDSQPGANRRKDRVTMIGLVIPAPAGLDDGQAIEWLSDAYDIACEEMGGDRNVIGGSIQVDERHEYVDARTGRTEMSRQHLHIYAIPEYEGKLNAKKVMTKGNMTRMNNRIEAMSQERYGLPWLTGEGRKSTESMDALKAKSAKAMIEKAEKQASEIVERARNKANTIINNATDQRLEAEDMYTDARKTRQKASESLSEASERLETVKSREEALEHREKAVKRSEMGLEKSKADIRRREKRLDAREEQIKSESKTLTELRTELEQLTISKVRLLGSKREWVHKEAVRYKDNPTAQNAQELLDALQQLDDNKQDKGMTL